MVVGVDLGGTKVAAAIVDETSGALRGRRVIPTEARAGPAAVLARIIDLVRDVCQKAGLESDRLNAVGIGVPGVVDLARGRTVLLPNLPGRWVDVPVSQTLCDALGCAVWLINDARAFVLAEARFGAGRGARTIIGLTLGTGVGGGIAIDGRLHWGIGGTAGEVGHQTIDPQGLPCGCGSRGCLETFVSGPAIAALGIRAVLQGMTTRIGALAGHDLHRITPETVKAAAEDGDAAAREILTRTGHYLGIGVANLVTVLSPNCVVIGGSVADLGDWLFEPVRATVRERCRTLPVDQVAIVPAAFAGDAGVIGAAAWAAAQQADARRAASVDDTM